MIEWVLVGLAFFWLLCGWAIAATLYLLGYEMGAALVVVWWAASWSVAIVLSQREKEKEGRVK